MPGRLCFVDVGVRKLGRGGIRDDRSNKTATQRESSWERALCLYTAGGMPAAACLGCSARTYSGHILERGAHPEQTMRCFTVIARGVRLWLTTGRILAHGTHAGFSAFRGNADSIFAV